MILPLVLKALTSEATNVTVLHPPIRPSRPTAHLTVDHNAQVHPVCQACQIEDANARDTASLEKEIASSWTVAVHDVAMVALIPVLLAPVETVKRIAARTNWRLGNELLLQEHHPQAVEGKSRPHQNAEGIRSCCAAGKNAFMFFCSLSFAICGMGQKHFTNPFSSFIMFGFLERAFRSLMTPELLL